MEINYSKSFVKKFIKLRENEKRRVRAAVKLFKANRYTPSLRLHKLTGHLKNTYSVSAGGDLRIIFKEENGFLIVTLLAVGSHNQVY